MSHLRGAATRPGTPGTRSQTLDRGLRVLGELRAAQGALSVSALASALGVHRSIVYRILRTLEDHDLVARSSDGGYELGLGLPQLARGVAGGLQSASAPVLSGLAEETAKTAFLAVKRESEVFTLVAAEPRRSLMHVAAAPGLRHPVGVGASGVAVMAMGSPEPDEREKVARARELGWCHTHGEVLPGMSSIAAGLRSAEGAAAVAVVYTEAGGVPGAGVLADRDRIAGLVRAAAEEIAAVVP